MENLAICRRLFRQQPQLKPLSFLRHSPKYCSGCFPQNVVQVWKQGHGSTVFTFKINKRHFIGEVRLRWTFSLLKTFAKQLNFLGSFSQSLVSVSVEQTLVPHKALLQGPTAAGTTCLCHWLQRHDSSRLQGHGESHPWLRLPMKIHFYWDLML